MPDPSTQVVRGRGHEHLSAVRLGGDCAARWTAIPRTASCSRSISARGCPRGQRARAVPRRSRRSALAADRTRQARRRARGSRPPPCRRARRRTAPERPRRSRRKARRSAQARSPSRRASSVEPTTSLKRMLPSTRLVRRGGRAPVTNSSTSSTIWSGSIETKWSTPGSSTNVAPGIRSPRYRPPRSARPVARAMEDERADVHRRTRGTSICEFIRSDRARRRGSRPRTRSPHHWAIASSAFGHIWRMSASQPHSRSIWSA